MCFVKNSVSPVLLQSAEQVLLSSQEIKNILVWYSLRKCSCIAVNCSSVS